MHTQGFVEPVCYRYISLPLETDEPNRLSRVFQVKFRQRSFQRDGISNDGSGSVFGARRRF